ncbi:probable serine/threonine-protein kinase At1g54610 [Andrographis paniculata]|uniref:probable serine/threonine-protein kinase At1g54610 n=1 Tax=Andrographis paniculata TaxID=175694 RepID=UPI0021E99C3D|nr:probable serine/threonine-protein kinase At1g54610 [Andrographis paniculata]
MGCAQSNGFSRDSPPHGLDRLKLENGYVKGAQARPRRSTGVRPEAAKGGSARARRSTDNGNTKGGKIEVRRSASVGVKPEGAMDTKLNGDGTRRRVVAGRASFGEKGNGGEDRAAAMEAAGRKSGSNRAESAKKSGEDELVDGWPKWLTDNIPREVLKSIVPKSADAFVKIDKIGQGTYSNVYKAMDRRTGKIVALKKVRFDTSEPESVKFMAREIMTLQKLDHPNIVKLEGLATSRMQYSIYLVFDYMQTDLARILSRPDERLTEPQIKCYMQQLLSGLEHCHERGILHRDIKGSNLLIDRNGMLKIADFGLANFFDSERRCALTNRVVTLWYRAPELLLGSTDYGAGIDLWSVGCLMAEMFAGRPILPGRTEVEQLHRIFKLCGTPSDDYYRRLRLSTDLKPPQMYKSVLREALKFFPPSSWDLLHTLLAMDPGHRGSARSALQNEFFHTSPLACDLSGLPVIHVEDDENEALMIDKRRHRRMRRRRKNDKDAEEPNGDAESSKGKQKTAEVSVFSSLPGSSATSTSSASGKTVEKVTSPPRIHQMFTKSEARPNPVKTFRPPMPAARKHILPDGTNRLDMVQRSASSREYRRSEK